MPSNLRRCTNCQGRFAPQQYTFASESCRLCTLEKELNTCKAENNKLKNKVQSLEEFVSTHIAADIPTTPDPAVSGKSKSYSAVVSAPETPISLLSPEVLHNNNSTPNNANEFEPVRNGVKVKPKLITPIETRNAFGPLADLVDQQEDSILVGDSMIRHQLEEFCERAPKQRKRYCYPGAKIDDIANELKEIMEKEKQDSLYIVHVGTNDVKTTNSEELIAKYKQMISTLKEKRTNLIISGILPRINAENQFYNKAFSTNNRLKSLCSKENVEFINLWDHFYDQKSLYNHDGLHLNPVGSARFGRLLNNVVEARRTKNREQRGLVTPSQ